MAQRRQSHSKPQWLWKNSRRAMKSSLGEEYCWTSSVPAAIMQVARMTIMSPMKAREQFGTQEWLR